MRLQGTIEDMEQVLKILSKVEGLKISNVSSPFANYGTLNFFRVYGEIELKDKKTHR